jgi:tetratricopeptide (TPR) repeat protein
MSWPSYEEIRQLYAAGEYDRALALIDERRSSNEDVWSHVSCIEANCHHRKGQIRTAVEILERADKRGTDNFWVYYQLGFTYWNSGMPDASALAYRKAHSLLGWDESSKNGYVFTHDFFLPNIPNWTKWFAESITYSPIMCLEIGSWQGGSATWLLDKIVSQRGGILTCIDTFEGSSEHAPWIDSIGDSIENIFDHNTRASGHLRFCQKMRGKSQSILPTLSEGNFHFIYIDGAHEAKYVIQDAVYSWRLLCIGGFLLFDDVDYKFTNAPMQNTIHAIQAFTDLFRADMEIIWRGRQMLIRKLS